MLFPKQLGGAASLSDLSCLLASTMPAADSESPDDTFFNDLSQRVPDTNVFRRSPSKADRNEGQKEDETPKAKRIACVLCRKRKLRCDGARPTCGTCNRLSHDCAYDDVRKKSGPKRGYVKLLEARLQQVETLLKNQDSSEQNNNVPRQDPASAYIANTLQQGPPQPTEQGPTNYAEALSPRPDALQNGVPNSDGDFSWEMIGLGLDEPLPPQDVVNDLYQIYFKKVHPSIPIIHKPRFLAAMNLGPQMRPPICLRYAMWTLAASVSDKYSTLQGHFYQRARKYAQADEMKGHGEATISVAHCQTWILTCTYEFKQMYFPRAWLSVGRVARLSQMMQLHRVDGVGLDVKQTILPPKDWTEREERRRTFWLAFAVDRYASIGTGWPMTIDERDILTNLPASDEAFEKSKPMPTSSLEEVLQPGGAAKLESFGGVVLTAAFFGRNLLHLHRPGPNEQDNDLNGGFWTRHREIENALLSTSLGLPESLRLPTGITDPNVVFLNMCIHTSAICLHQAAIFKADKHRLPVTVSNESKVRCVTAAAEIASLMRAVSHQDLSAMNPFISFCIYVAARVFVQYLRTRPKDQQMSSSLQFLLQAMQALRRKNPLTESFLAQLDVDLESAGIRSSDQWRIKDSDFPEDTFRRLGEELRCPNMFEPRESQAASSANANSETRTMSGIGQDVSPQFESTPGPPFHRASIKVNLEPQNLGGFVPSQGATQLNLPARDRRPLNDEMRTYTIPDNNEMDVSTDDQPSPATTNSQSQSQSRVGSTSHSSHSPAYPAELHNLQFRDSRKSNMANNILPQPAMSTAMNPNPNAAFFSASESVFSATMYSTGSTMGGDPNGFMMGHEWDVSAMGAGATGMTPMSEGSWNQMLESMNMEEVNMGWDTMGPTHLGSSR